MQVSDAEYAAEGADNPAESVLQDSSSLPCTYHSGSAC